MKSGKSAIALGMGLVALGVIGNSSAALAVQNTADLVRAHLPVLYQEFHEVSQYDCPGVNVAPAEEGAIALDADRGPHHIRVVLRDVNPDDVDQKLREAATAIYLDLKEYDREADEYFKSVQTQFVSAVSDPVKMAQTGAGIEIGGGESGGFPYISVWTALPPVHDNKDDSNGSSELQFLRTSVVLQGAMAPDSGGSPIIISKINFSTLEVKVGRGGLNQKSGEPQGLQFTIRALDLMPMIRNESGVEGRDLSTGRVDMGIFSVGMSSLQPIGSSGVELAAGFGVRAAVVLMDQHRENISRVVGQGHFEIGLVFNKTIFISSSAGIDGFSNSNTNRESRSSMVENYEFAGGIHFAPSSSLKLGVRYQYGSSPYLITPEGWSAFSSYQLLF